MKLVVFAGTPGSGKTSIIKHVVCRIKEKYDLLFVKYDCLKTDDDELIGKKYGISAIKLLAEELCPDHYTALTLPKVIHKYHQKDIIIIETAGLCLRCSPYVEEGLGINVLDITAGNPNRYGPILTKADIVAVSKGDLISQAEREIFRVDILDVNNSANIVEVNGLTGEGSIDLSKYIVSMLDLEGDKKLTLKDSMPSAICGYCYGNKIIDDRETYNRYVAGKTLKALVPNKNCGACGFKSCNEFIRAVLDKKVEKSECPFIKKK